MFLILSDSDRTFLWSIVDTVSTSSCSLMNGMRTMHSQEFCEIQVEGIEWRYEDSNMLLEGEGERNERESESEMKEEQEWSEYREKEW